MWESHHRYGLWRRGIKAKRYFKEKSGSDKEKCRIIGNGRKGEEKIDDHGKNEEKIIRKKEKRGRTRASSLIKLNISSSPQKFKGNQRLKKNLKSKTINQSKC